LDHAFFNAGVMIRPAGDTIELTPPLIVSEDQIGEIIEKVGASIKAAA
ncbi:MAG TPA: aspartate aminotransferase family protein, partial [Roseiarcus sp.]|nr:aspartate aminotransferase family protein [Roseiarcus sp.]